MWIANLKKKTRNIGIYTGIELDMVSTFTDVSENTSGPRISWSL